MMCDPADLTATAAARAIAAGSLTPAALIEACLARIAQREPVLQAMAHLDPAQVRAARPAPGPLHGLPLGVKDVIDTADMPSEYNSAIWREHRPRADAACVAWAKAVGAVVLGKTVTTEFATRFPGPTTNPHDPTRTPGGSSSGAAAGVAAGYFPFAYGTQTAGSVIRPAAYCGVVGFKPSFGTINRFGMKLMSESLDTVGVLARSVADCALLTSAVTGLDLGNPDARSDRAPRIGVCRSPMWDRRKPETDALFDTVPGRLARAGAQLADFELPPEFAPLEAAHTVVMNAESARTLGWEMNTARDKLSPVLRERMEWGLAQPAAALIEARGVFRRLQDAFDGATGNFDILLTPSAPGVAPVGLEWTGDPAFNLLWTSLHVPCVTVPAGTGPGGLPLGVQIVARRGQDREALMWAAWIAAALG
jgi:Asp-tRNA(Asn)/Glu-tRNA(Gln) amidotransferase A subunit family amidase